MPDKPPPEEKEEGAPAWMLTYGDMVTLVLTFFVLLVSMMVVDPKKFVEVLGTYQNQTGDGDNRITEDDPVKTENYFMQIIRVAARRSETLEGGDDVTMEGEAVRVFAFEENYITSLADQPFFQPFEIRLTVDAKARLEELARKIKRHAKGHSIKIIGHYAPDEDGKRFDQQRQPVMVPDPTMDDDDIVGGEEYMRVVRLFETRSFSGDSETEPRFMARPGDLAYYRARAVKEFLAAKGISTQNMSLVAGGAIRKSRVHTAAGARATLFSDSDGNLERPEGVGMVDIYKGSAESDQSLKERDFVDEMKTVRPWPQFIFTDAGSSYGRLVEIVITGDLSG